MKLKLYSLLFMLISSHLLCAQQYYNQRPEFLKANSVWAFGRHAGLDFNGSNPIAMQTSSFAWEGVASVADPVTGDLLFYLDRKICYSANHLPMANGRDLFGNVGTTSQGACIVPVIDSPGKYYLFSLTGANGLHLSNGFLFYSVVDMSLDNGLGDIVPGRKNIVLEKDTLSESMIAIPGNDCDVWLLVHGYLNAEFKAYHITAQGIATKPIVSIVAPEARLAYLTGCLAVSPDRSTIAIASGPYAPQGVLLAKFNATTGQVSNGLKITTAGSYGVCFSPDNSKLYVSERSSALFKYQGTVYQYDVSVHDLVAVTSSKVIIEDSMDANDASYLKSYDGKIYTSGYNKPYVSCINQPNLAGVGCDYQEQAVSLISGTATRLGLPNDLVYPLPPDTLRILYKDTLVCGSNDLFTPLSFEARSGGHNYYWEDGSTDTVRIVDRPGTYWVRYKVFNECLVKVDTYKIGISPPSPHTFTAVICANEYYQFKDTFLSQSGTYSDTFIGTRGCDSLVQLNLIVLPLPKIGWALRGDVSVCIGDTVTLNASGATYYSWYDIMGADLGYGKNLLFSPRIPENQIIVVGKADNNCMDSAWIKIDAKNCCALFIPNAFSPNSDGLNDVFGPAADGHMKNYQLSIYNRWGERIFSSFNINNKWDGMYLNTPSGVGTYHYYITVECMNGTALQRKGDFSLIR